MYTTPTLNKTVLFTGWVDVTEAMCGLFTSSTTTERGLNIPVVYETESSALDAVKEAQEEYEQDIANGEREEGDVYEGCVQQMQIMSDGTVFFPETGQASTAAFICGCSQSEIDMEVMTSFSNVDCFDFPALTADLPTSRNSTMHNRLVFEVVLSGCESALNLNLGTIEISGDEKPYILDIVSSVGFPDTQDGKELYRITANFDTLDNTIDTFSAFASDYDFNQSLESLILNGAAARTNLFSDNLGVDSELTMQDINRIVEMKIRLDDGSMCLAVVHDESY